MRALNVHCTYDIIKYNMTLWFIKEQKYYNTFILYIWHGRITKMLNL